MFGKYDLSLGVSAVVNPNLMDNDSMAVPAHKIGTMALSLAELYSRAETNPTPLLWTEVCDAIRRADLISSNEIISEVAGHARYRIGRAMNVLVCDK